MSVLKQWFCDASCWNVVWVRRQWWLFHVCARVHVTAFLNTFKDIFMLCMFIVGNNNEGVVE